MKAGEMAKLRANRDELDRQARVIARPYVDEEREACAKVVEAHADMFCDCMGTGGERPEDYAKELADLIRRRKS